MKIKRLNNKGGALIWVIFTMMIVSIFLGIIYTLLQSFVTRSVLSRDSRQAYLTARSVCDTIGHVIVKETDEAFLDEVNRLAVGELLEVQDIVFNTGNNREEGVLNPTYEMGEASGKVIKVSPNTLKVIGEAEVGKGEKSVGMELEATPRGGEIFYFNNGVELHFEHLALGENTSTVMGDDFSIGDVKMLGSDGWFNKFSMIQVEDGDLMVKGNVKLVKVDNVFNPFIGKLPAFINGKLVAEGDILLQNIHVGRQGESGVAISTPGKLTLDTKINEVNASNIGLNTQVSGTIVCDTLEINIAIGEPTTIEERMIIDGDIQAPGGVFINDLTTNTRKQLSFDQKPLGASENDAVFYVEDFREDKGKNLVITGEEVSGIAALKIPPSPSAPQWVEDAPENPEIISFKSWPQETLVGGHYYRVETDKTEVNFADTLFENVTPDTPVTLIIPKNIKFNDPIKGGDEQGATYELGLGQHIYTDNPNKGMYKGYKPLIRFIVEDGATLQLVGDTYANVYGKGGSTVKLSNNALIGNVITDKVITENDASTFVYLSNTENTQGSGYKKVKYFDP